MPCVPACDRAGRLHRRLTRAQPLLPSLSHTAEAETALRPVLIPPIILHPDSSLHLGSVHGGQAYTGQNEKGAPEQQQDTGEPLLSRNCMQKTRGYSLHFAWSRQAHR